MEITPPRSHTLTFTGVLTESRRIIKSNYPHFLTLSLLFLPFSISLIISPSLRLNHPLTFPPTHRNSPPFHLLVYLLLIYTLTLCATSSITCNAHHIFSSSNTPITTPLTTLTTVTNSLLPLAFTAFVSHALMLLALLGFLMLVGLGFMSVETLFGLRFVVEFDSVYFMAFAIIVSVVVCVVVMWLYVNWLLVNVVVVTESKWGFQALVRSWYLVKGMRSVAVKLFLFYGVLEGFFVMVYSGSLFGYGVGMGRWTTLVNAMFGSYFLMLLLLYSSVANVVLYNYCKAVHGELAIDVAEGFVCDYVGLRDDGEKVPYVVTVVTA